MDTKAWITILSPVAVLLAIAGFWFQYNLKYSPTKEDFHSVSRKTLTLLVQVLKWVIPIIGLAYFLFTKEPLTKAALFGILAACFSIAINLLTLLFQALVRSQIEPIYVILMRMVQTDVKSGSTRREAINAILEKVEEDMAASKKAARTAAHKALDSLDGPQD